MVTAFKVGLFLLVLVWVVWGAVAFPNFFRKVWHASVVRHLTRLRPYAILSLREGSIVRLRSHEVPLRVRRVDPPWIELVEEKPADATWRECTVGHMYPARLLLDELQSVDGRKVWL